MYALLLEEQKRFEKIAVNSIYCMLALAIFSGQALFTNNSLFAHETISPSMGAGLYSTKLPPANQPSLAVEKNKWDKNIRQKYRNARITYVDSGIVHVKLTKYINSQPIKINVVEVNRKINPNIELAPALASSTLARKATIRNIAQKNNAVVAVNGTYFKPQSGVPLGTLMIDKKILTGPIYNRVAMGIGENDFKMARVEFDGKIHNLFTSVPIDNINQPRMLATHVLAYTRDWGQYSPPTPKYGVQMAIQDGKIIQISDGSIQIPKDGYVISGPKEKLKPFFNGKSVQIDINTSPNWNDMKHIVSGGPYLVKDGNLFVDTAAQKLNAISGKNPRTAIGYTADNNFIIVTIDGREQSSVGVNIWDLAKIMKSFGCYNAMNLDGGGSSVMYVKGNIVNAPAVKGGIALSNAFTVSITPDTKISYDERE
ncbi:MAG: phosphodiester glycosidase family protein [Candidatus Gastranaerophilales bacterium]|nr:phosphodiester glycosidase family protein [Candidatus Gastranaerophilales bacterium]